MPTITGDIITDAVVNLKTALETQIATWEVSEVFRYQSAEVGKRGNCIAIEVVGWQPVLSGLASPTVVIDHKVTMRVWYIHGTNARIDVAYDKVYSRLSKMVAYIIENPMPNGYGTFLIDDQAFGPTVETLAPIEAETGVLLAGKFTVIHTYTKSHTQTFA
jgi:hypothetical protein